MADDKMKLELEVDIQVKRAKEIADLDKRIHALNDKIEAGDAKAIKGAAQLTRQREALAREYAAEEKAIARKAKAEKKAADDRAKAEKAAAREAEKKVAAEKKAEKERQKAARQKEKDDKAAVRAANEKIRLEIEHSKERRKAAKEARLAHEGEQQSISRTQRARDRATKASIKGFRDQAKNEAKNAKDAVANVVKFAKNRRKAAEDEIKDLGRRARMMFSSQKLEEGIQSRMFSGFRVVQRIKARMQRDAERAAGIEKRMNDARTRHEENSLNNARAMQQYMQRHLSSLRYQGAIQQQIGRSALTDLRTRLQGAQSVYKSQMNLAKASGKWDAQAEQRIKTRYDNETKSARRAFTTRMAFAREEQREYDRTMGRGRRNISGGFGTARDGAGSALNAGRGVGIGVMAAGAATGVAIERAIQSRMTIDMAETKLRMFGGTGTEKMSQADVVKNRKGWLDQAAIKNGLSPAGAINAFTEVLKADIPANMAKDVTQMILEGVSGADMPLDETTKLVSRLNYLKPTLGTSGLKRGLNDVSVAAATTGADPNEIVSSLRRGAGALAISPNMSFGDLAALTGVGISTGMQEGQAGTFMEHQLRYAATAKYQSPHRKQELAKGYKLLGMGSLGEVQKQATEDGAGFLEKLFTAINKLAKTDINKANKAADLIGGEYWTKNMLMMAQAADPANNKISAARRSVREDGGDHLDNANQQKINSWQGLWNSTKTVFSLFMDDMGKGFEDIFTSAGTFAREFGSKFDRSGITLGIKSALDGIKNGLGIDSWKQGLAKIFGSGEGGMSIANANKIRKFTTGFTEGIVGVVEGIKSMASAFGLNTDPKALGKLAGQIAALSIALVALTPVISILTGVIGIFKVIGGVGRMMFGAAGIGAGLMARGGVGAVAGTALRAFTGWAGIGMAIGSAIIDYIAPRIATKLKELLPDFTHGAVDSARNAVTGGDNFVGNATTWILDLFRNRSQGHATGGWVSGPGGPTSDSIMARLSNGEFVVNASAAQRHRGLLEMINSGGMPGFAEGGSVGGGATPFTNGYGMNDAEIKKLIEAINELTRIMRDDQRDRLFSRPRRAGFGGGIGSGGGSVGGGSVGSGLGPSRSTPGGALGGTGMRMRGIMGGGAYTGGSTGPTGSAAANFASLSPKIMADLQKDFGLDKESAAAIMGNLGHESAGMTAFQEGNPRGGGRGGWGWAQWTGSRRRAFEAFAAERGLDPKSYEANYGFLKHELNGTHRSSLAAVKNATGLEGKTIAFENSYEAAGVKHYDRRIGYARTAMGLNGDSPGGGGITTNLGPAGNNPADAASRFLGMGEFNNRAAVEGFVGHDIRGAANAWCARFVNSSLAAVGQRGTGSAVANSFLRWGQAISADMIQKGDVMVEHRNKGVDGQGGHVGLSTGRTRRGRSGELEMEMISGNSDDQVKTSWEKASKIAVRRGVMAATQQAAQAATAPAQAAAAAAQASPVNGRGNAAASGDWINDNGIWKDAQGRLAPPDVQQRLNANQRMSMEQINQRFGGQGAALRAIDQSAAENRSAGFGANGQPLGMNTPLRSAPAGAGAGGRRSDAGGGNQIAININGHNKSPQELAAEVQRHLQDSMNRRTHDYDGFS